MTCATEEVAESTEETTVPEATTTKPDFGVVTPGSEDPDRVTMIMNNATARLEEIRNGTAKTS